jgi:hypothetical protein
MVDVDMSSALGWDIWVSLTIGWTIDLKDYVKAERASVGMLGTRKIQR